VLDELETQMGGTPLAESFDLIAGTSTGGILALGLTRPERAGGPMAPDDLIALYENNGEDIFGRSVVDWLVRGNGLWAPEHPNDGLESVLQEKLGEDGGEPVMLDEVQTELLVTS
jgi:hypothetical protein